jgi:hypothetical protein
MGDLPSTYQALMPTSSDPAELARAEQSIRSAYRRDMATEVPRHVAQGLYVGQDPPPEVLDYQDKLTAARAAMDAGDVEEAHRLLGEARGQAPASQHQLTAEQLKGMSASDKIIYGLNQEQMPPRRTGPASAMPRRALVAAGTPRTGPGAVVSGPRMSASQKIAAGLAAEGVPTRSNFPAAAAAFLPRRS